MRLTQKSIIICIAVIMSGILIGAMNSGFIYNQFHLFGNFLYSIFFTALAITMFLGLVIDFIIKPKFVILSTVCLLLFLFTVTVTSKSVLKIAEHNAIYLAKKIINEIDKYHHEHGYYPESIDSLKTDILSIAEFKRTQRYNLLEKNLTFKIVVWNDGWYDYVYYSRDKSWRKVD